MSSITYTAPRTMKPVMPSIQRQVVNVPAAPAPKGRIEAVLKTLFGAVVLLALTAGVFTGISRLGDALEDFTASTVGVIRTQHVPSSERAQVTRTTSADPVSMVRSAG